VPKTIGQQALRRRLSQVMGEVTYGEEIYLIESYGRPAAVLLSVDEYQRLQTIALEPGEQRSRIISPRLADPSQARDFVLEVIPEGADA
jgi:prevent-host-death family protein